MTAHRASGPDFEAVLQLLRADVPQLVRELLPSGAREGHEWKVGSLSGEKGRSLSVHIGPGAKCGLWADFASDLKGDIFELVAQVKFGGDRKATWKWAVDRYGLGGGGNTQSQRQYRHASQLASPPRGGPSPSGRREQEIDRDVKTEKKAKAIYLKADADLRGSLTLAYLWDRGIDLKLLNQEPGKFPGAIRHHGALHCHEIGRPLPAMVAAINGPGKHFTIHRTWLAEGFGGRVTKAPLKSPRKVYSKFKGGAIRVWKGASGRRIEEADWGETLVLTEGVEDALVAAIARPDLRVHAVVAINNFAEQDLPASIRTVILCVDNEGNDKAEGIARRAIDRAVTRFQQEDRAVRLVRSSVGKDLNDRLLGKE